MAGINTKYAIMEEKYLLEFEIFEELGRDLKTEWTHIIWYDVTCRVDRQKIPG